MKKPLSDNTAKPANFDESSWQAVRLPPLPGFRPSQNPDDTNDVATDPDADNRELREMLKWLARYKVENWWREQFANGSMTFWFEQRDDAMAFATRWFPFRAL